MISTLDIHGLKENISDLKETVRDSIFQENPNANVGNSERIVSLATGTFIFLKGIGNLFSHPTLALGEAVVGGLLVYRGVTGYCPVKEMAEKREDVLPDTVIITSTEY